MSSNELRCKKCNKLLALKLEGTLEIYCPRCKTYNKFIKGEHEDAGNP